MQSDPQLSIFTTANWISQIPKEQQKKFSARDFFNDTFEKVKSAIGPSSILTGSVASNTASLKRDKKGKKTKIPSAQFYDKIEDTTDSCNNRNPMERNKKESGNIMSLDSDEFKKSIENREKSLERRATTTNTVQTQTQPQSGILKNKHKAQTKPSSLLKPNEPEIVVINNKDIDESTRQEGNVIVIEKERQNMELVELLGDNWPTAAGDTAAILNKQKLQNANNTGSSATGNSIGTTNKSNRNKSPSPLIHFPGNNVKKTNDLIFSNNKNIDSKKLQSKFL